MGVKERCRAYVANSGDQSQSHTRTGQGWYDNGGVRWNMESGKLRKVELRKLCSVIDVRHREREKKNLSCVGGEMW